MTFDVDLGFKITRNVAQYPLHHVTYAATKFEVARSNGLGGDTFTRKVTDAQTDGQRTDFGTKLIYPVFLKKRGYKILLIYRDKAQNTNSDKQTDLFFIIITSFCLYICPNKVPYIHVVVFAGLHVIVSCYNMIILYVFKLKGIIDKYIIETILLVL